jgi:hypothetical protein
MPSDAAHVAAELIEEGLLTTRPRAGGGHEYVLTPDGVTQVEQLLEHSPAARRWLANLKKGASDEHAEL